MISIFDIDGTVADHTHRAHYIKGASQDWDKFYEPALVLKDKPIEKAVLFIRKVIELKHELYFLTGRPESVRDATMQWLREHVLDDAISDERLMMRTGGNFMGAVEYKREQITDLRSRTSMHNSCYLFFEDDQRCWEMMREFGLVFRAPECFDYINPVKEEEVVPA